MKKSIFLAFFFLVSCSSAPIENSSIEDLEAQDEIVTSSTNKVPDEVRVHVSVITHSEEYKKTGSEPDYVNDEDAFWSARKNVVNFAEMLHEEGVKYNYQSDWTFLLAATKFDKGDESTNGKNFLRYLKEDLGFEIDPHAHESEYSYADVAYLINELGVEPSNTAGGYIASPANRSKLEYLWEPVKGRIYKYTWQAEILWGGGTANHVDEEELWYSGIWRPKSDEQTTVNDDNAGLINVGRYKSGWDALDYLLEQDLKPGKIYTLGVMGHQRELDSTFIEEFRTQIQKFKKDERIVWTGLAEVVEIWKKDYSSEANMLKYDGLIEEDSAGFGGGGNQFLKNKLMNN